LEASHTELEDSRQTEARIVQWLRTYEESNRGATLAELLAGLSIAPRPWTYSPEAAQMAHQPSTGSDPFYEIFGIDTQDLQSCSDYDRSKTTREVAIQTEQKERTAEASNQVVNTYQDSYAPDVERARSRHVTLYKSEIISGLAKLASGLSSGMLELLSPATAESQSRPERSGAVGTSRFLYA
jgi:hypothetical protein